MLRGQLDASPGRRVPAYLSALAALVLVGVTGAAGPGEPRSSRPPQQPLSGPVTAVARVPVRIPPAARAPDGLPVIEYWTSPRGFPADPAPMSTAALTMGLHPTTRLVAYDAPGGKPRAYLPPSISGVPVTVPIVERRPGWVAVLLPSVNRRIGWLPARGWTSRSLRDHLVLRRRTHELTWFRDGTRRASWTVAVGTAATPTPLGRTFVLGRTSTHGAMYAGLDALVLGSVPDDRQSVAPGLRNAHTGIHGWYRASAFGRSVSNGCIRMPKSGQRALLDGIAAGTAVLVVD